MNGRSIEEQLRDKSLEFFNSLLWADAEIAFDIPSLLRHEDIPQFQRIVDLFRWMFRTGNRASVVDPGVAGCVSWVLAIWSAEEPQSVGTERLAANHRD